MKTSCRSRRLIEREEKTEKRKSRKKPYVRKLKERNHLHFLSRDHHPLAVLTWKSRGSEGCRRDTSVVLPKRGLKEELRK